ncbi:MAG: CpaF family protein [Actinomycetota bacterium]
MIEELLERVYERDELAALDPPARRLALRALVAGAGPEDAPQVLRRLVDEVDGFGILAPLIADETVTDVLVNGPDEIWVERAGALEHTSLRFRDPAALGALVNRLLSAAGARADSSHPIADARLPGGARMHVVLPPVAPAGPLVSIRTFPATPLTLEDLVARAMLTAEQGAALRTLVRARTSIAIGGRTGTGKTTLLNALLGELPSAERVVVVEETPELRPRCGHAVSLVTRVANVEGRGGIDLACLVRAALRMRPDRIVVGEVRGAEALPALSALSTGHEGSLLSVHARSAAQVLDRLVSLALEAGSPASERSLREIARASFGAILHLDRDGAGHRRVVEILEVG